MSLLEKTFDRTLDAWTHAYMAPAWRGAVVEGWLFEGVEARRAAQERLAQAGVTARFRSAYKPLLHYFLEEVEREGLASIVVRYPLHEHAQAKRFTLEAYPLIALLQGVDVAMQPGADDLHYDVSLRYADGRELDTRVYAPNQVGYAQDGTPELSPTGWLRVRDAEGALQTDAAQATEYQQAFRAILDTVRNHAWGAHEPYFERLEIRVDLPGIDFALPVDEEIVSTFEALHEDIYFSLLEHFQKHSGRPSGDRGLQPGQIIPDIRRHDGAARVQISLEHFGALAPVAPAPLAAPLAQAREPLSAGQIASCMAAFGGDCAAPVPRSSFRARSTPTKPLASSAPCARRKRWPSAATRTSP